ncbi:efflux transporter outer membrane subunit [Sphingomonas sp.]
MTARRLTFALLALSVAGCSMAPDYRRPAPAVPPQLPQGAAYPDLPAEAAPMIGYRDIFRDPQLQALIERALVNNQDVRLALANIDIARGQLRVARADLLPGIDASGGVNLSRGSGRGGIQQGIIGGNGVVTRYDVQAGLSAFEIDLFGRVRAGADAALNEYLATEAGLRAARLSLVAETASAWLTLAADRSLLAIARDTVANAERGVELTGARLRGGIVPRTDLRQAETILQQARSDVANLTTLVAQDRNALELLVGAPVADGELPTAIEVAETNLAAPPAGLDSSVLLARPDVVQSEFRLAAANARIGATRAAFFPRITLTGLLGFASNALGSLFSGDRFNWNAGVNAGVPIFDGGFNRGNLEVTEAQREAALATYQRTIQVAFREVADALARRGTIDEQFAAQQGLEAAAADNAAIADARYREGIDNFLLALDAQRTLYSARQAVVNARLFRANNIVTLYRVLGGDERIPNATERLENARGSRVLRGRE